MSQNSIGLVINGTMEIAPEDREIRYIFAVDVMACPKF
jgi:hypothetical protein